MEVVMITGKVVLQEPALPGKVFRVKVSLSFNNQQYNSPAVTTGLDGAFRFEIEIRRGDFGGDQGRTRRRELGRFPEKGVPCWFEVFDGEKPIVIDKPERTLTNWTNQFELSIPAKERYTVIKGHIIEKSSGKVIQDPGEIRVSIVRNFKPAELYRAVVDKGTYSVRFPSIPKLLLKFSRVEVDVTDLDGRSTSVLKMDYGSTIEEGVENKHDFEVTFPDYEFSREVLRPWDLLALKFRFKNIKLSRNKLRPVFLSRQALLIVEFSPQSIVEMAFFQEAIGFPIKEKKAENGTVINKNDVKSKPENPEIPPIVSRLSGSSRLAFKVPNGDEIEYSIQGLLSACKRLEMNVHPTALPPADSPVYHIADKSKMENQFGSIIFNKDIFKKGTGADPYIMVGSGSSSPLASSLIFECIPKENELKLESEIIFFLAKLINDPKPELSAPTEDQTAIEAPFRLILSPHVYSEWNHDSSGMPRLPLFFKDPRGNGKVLISRVIELWNSRLGSKYNADVFNYVRAIWTKDWEREINTHKTDYNKVDQTDHYPSPPKLKENNPFRMSLDFFDRQNIVHLSANHFQLNKSLRPVKVENLMLTSLGAWLNVRGEWNPPVPLSVEEWLHRATMGRDHYVKVVYKGYLFPFGHRASLIKVTERKLHSAFQQIIVRTVEEFSATTLKLLDDPRIRQKYDIRNFTNSLVMEFRHIATGFMLSLEGKNENQIGKLVGENSAKIRNFAANNITQFETGKRGVGGSRLEKELKDIQTGASRMLTGLAKAATGGNIVRKGYIAYLFQRMYIVVREPLKRYDDLDVNIYLNIRKWPFAAVKFKTLVTPDLSDPSSVNPISGQAMFWPSVGSEPFLFHLCAEDKNGNISEFTAPVIFLENQQAKSAGDINKASENYGERDITWRKRQFFGQPVLFAPAADNPEMATLETVSLTFGGVGVNLDKSKDEPWYYPVLEEAEVKLPAMKYLLGEAPVAKIKYFDVYVKDGFGPQNKGEVFAEILPKEDFVIDFNRQGDKAGGMVTPNIRLTGISRLIGPCGGDLNTVAAGKLDPADFFKEVDAKIFGAIPLPEILAVINDFTGETLKVPKFLPKVDSNPRDLILFDWEPELRAWKSIFIPGQEAKMSMKAKLLDYKNSANATENQKPELSIESTLENFTLNMIGNVETFFLIRFKSISFKSGGGVKSSIDVKIKGHEEKGIEFAGVLSFVETLKNLIPTDGFSNPSKNGGEGTTQKQNGFALQVTDEGIVSSYSLTLQNTQIGIFSLSNLSLGASFSIPFRPDPMMIRFNFCQRHLPFDLSVSMLGGGGFFGIALTTAGVHTLEASFEFGASLSLNFGVASGGVHVKAGIYFLMELAKNEASLTGYLRIGGNVSVLGIINASIELYMSLTYQFSSGKVIGRASLTIEIEIIFFSISVTLTVERKFAGSNGDPTFADLMGPAEDPITHKMLDPWKEYCQAFA